MVKNRHGTKGGRMMTKEQDVGSEYACAEADKGGALPCSQHISQTSDSGGTCERSGAETMGGSFTKLLICKSVHREEGSLKLHPILYYISMVSLRKKDNQVHIHWWVREEPGFSREIKENIWGLPCVILPVLGSFILHLECVLENQKCQRMPQKEKEDLSK